MSEVTTEERLQIIEGLLGPLGGRGEQGRVVFAAFRIAHGADPAEVREELTQALGHYRLGVNHYWPAPEGRERMSAEKRIERLRELAENRLWDADLYALFRWECRARGLTPSPHDSIDLMLETLEARFTSEEAR
jgi:hypothetical protein